MCVQFSQSVCPNLLFGAASYAFLIYRSCKIKLFFVFSPFKLRNFDERRDFFYLICSKTTELSANKQAHHLGCMQRGCKLTPELLPPT